MNEEALKDAYKLFTETGYNGSVEDFSVLIETNDDALKDAYKLFTETGYNGSIEDFSVLVKKKDQTEPSMESVQETTELVSEKPQVDGGSESVTVETPYQPKFKPEEEAGSRYKQAGEDENLPKVIEGLEQRIADKEVQLKKLQSRDVSSASYGMPNMSRRSDGGAAYRKAEEELNALKKLRRKKQETKDLIDAEYAAEQLGEGESVEKVSKAIKAEQSLEGGLTDFLARGVAAITPIKTNYATVKQGAKEALESYVDEELKASSERVSASQQAFQSQATDLAKQTEAAIEEQGELYKSGQISYEDYLSNYANTVESYEAQKAAIERDYDKKATFVDDYVGALENLSIINQYDDLHPIESGIKSFTNELIKTPRQVGGLLKATTPILELLSEGSRLRHRISQEQFLDLFSPVTDFLSETTDANLLRVDEDDSKANMIGEVSGQLAKIIPASIANPAAGIAVSAGMSFDEMYQTAIQGDVTEAEAVNMAAIYTPIGTLLEYAGARTAIGAVDKKFARELAFKIIKEQGLTKMGKKQAQIALKDGLFKQLGINMTKEFLEEGTTEALQTIVQEGIKQGKNIESGREIYKYDAETFIDNIKEAFVYGGIAGAGVAGVSTMVGMGGKAKPNYDIYKETITNPTIYNRLVDKISNDKEMTDSDKAIAFDTMKRDLETFQSVEGLGLSVNTQKKAVELITRKKVLEKAIEGKDKALTADIRKQIKAIDETLESFKPEIETGVENAMQEAVQEEAEKVVEEQEKETVEGETKQEPTIDTNKITEDGDTNNTPDILIPQQTNKESNPFAAMSERFGKEAEKERALRDRFLEEKNLGSWASMNNTEKQKVNNEYREEYLEWKKTQKVSPKPNKTALEVKREPTKAEAQTEETTIDDGNTNNTLDTGVEETKTAEQIEVKEAEVETEFNSEVESATEEQLNEINQEYERINERGQEETNVTTTEGEVEANETVETKQEGKTPKRDVGVEVVAQDLPDISKAGNETQIAITDSVTAKVKVIKLPDGETAYSVEIYRDGEIVADKDGDTSVEFTNEEAQQLVDNLNKKQRGFILAKQPKTPKKAKQSTSSNEIKEGDRIKFTVFGAKKEGIAGKGGSARAADGTLYVAPMISNVEVVTPKQESKPKVTPSKKPTPEKEKTKPNKKKQDSNPKPNTSTTKDKPKTLIEATKGGLDSADNFLANLEKQLKDFGDGTLGVNLPVSVAIVAVRAARLAVRAGKTAAEAIDAAIKAVEGSKWYENLSNQDKSKVPSQVKALFNQPIAPPNRKNALKQTEEAFEKSDARTAANQSPKGIANKVFDFFRSLRTMLIDRQARVKDAIESVGLKNTKNFLVNAKGASGYANRLYQQAADKIYKGLNSEQQLILDKMIMLRRIIALDTSYDARDKLRVQHPNKLNKEIAEAALQEYKEQLGEKTYNKLQSRADAYFDAYKEILLMAKKEGIINQKTYDMFKDMDYQPRRFLKFMFSTETTGKARDRAMQNMAMENGVSESFIKSLEGGSTTEIFYDSRFLLQASYKSIATRIAQNKANRKLAEEINSMTKKELVDSKDLFRKSKQLGFKKNGDPRYASPPDGFLPIQYKENGQLKQVLINEKYYEQWYDLNRLLSPEAANIIQKVSGTRILKAMATGMNPLFIATNVPRDFGHILLFTNAYDNVKVLGTPLMPVNGAILAKDGLQKFLGILTKNKKTSELLDQAAQDGILMDFLSIQGRIEFKGLKGFLSPAKKALNAIGKSLSYLGELSEISFRLAVYENTINQETKKYKKEHGKEPDERAIENIRGTAAAKAREIIDFNQGGTHVKAAENILPYLNAATQGARVSLEYSRRNPVDMISKTIQAAGFAASIILYNIAVFGEDEWEDIPDYIRIRNFVFLLPQKDKEGNRMYLKIAKPQQAIPIFTSAENVTLKLINEAQGTDNETKARIRDEEAIDALSEFMPLQPTPREILSRNPIYSGMVGYLTNHDLYRDKQITRDFGKVLPQDEGKYSENVDEVYKAVGEATGLSPARTQVAVEKIITSPTTNPLVGLAYAGANAIVSDKDAEAVMNKAMKKSLEGVNKKFFRSVNPEWRSFKTRELTEIQRLEDGSEKMEWNAKVREFATENIDKEDMPVEVEEWIESNIPPEQMKSYFQKYYSYQMADGIPYKFKNIAYEQDPKMQARLFRMHFGDIESIDDDELNALFENFAMLGWKPSKRFYIENQRMNEEAKKEANNGQK